MTAPVPYCFEVGSGPTVICLHANASSSAQWRPLASLLAPRYRVIAADLYGAGKSPEWPSRGTIRLLDEVELVKPIVDGAGGAAVLVGHSYGAAVALMAALQFPGRVAALVLYEPTLFALVDAERAPPNDADGIREVVAGAANALDAQDPDAAARQFVDYWMEPGSWERTPERRKEPILKSIANIRRWGHALFTEPTRLEAFRALDLPTLVLTGGRSTPSARAVARLLLGTLPRAKSLEFAALGHMGPVTDADTVNAAIAEFLDSTLTTEAKASASKGGRREHVVPLPD